MSNQVKTKRRFTKRLIISNMLAAWSVLIASVPYGAAEAIATHVFAFNTMLIGIYTGIGHMDYRKFMDVAGSASQRREHDL